MFVKLSILIIITRENAREYHQDMEIHSSSKKKKKKKKKKKEDIEIRDQVVTSVQC